MVLSSLVGLVLLVWAVWLYNRLVRDRNRVTAAWSDIGVQLKRRHALIPRLVETVRQYAAYEAATLQAITEVRNRSDRTTDVGEIGSLESDLGSHLRRLLAVAEDYPDLKADRSFVDLQQNLTQVENDLQYVRRYYNGAVRNLNVRIDSFPDVLIARAFRFRPARFFRLDAPGERDPAEVH